MCNWPLYEKEENKTKRMNLFKGKRGPASNPAIVSIVSYLKE